MAKYTYDDVVRISPSAEDHLRPGQRVWIVGVFEHRTPGSYFDKFPAGTVYSVEYEDGASTEVHEMDLQDWAEKPGV